MLISYFRAIGQLSDPRIVRVLVRSLLLSAAVFVALWASVAWLLTNTTLTSYWGLETLLDVLGGAGALVATFFLFPVVVSAFLGLFLESVARAVELRHYPSLPEPRGLGLVAGSFASLRFVAAALLVNLALLPFLLAPVLYPFAWLLANAYLLSREHFELVAMRRMDARSARDLRRRHRIALLLGGSVAAAMFAVPGLNLLAPVLVTMAMTHQNERWRPRLS